MFIQLLGLSSSEPNKLVGLDYSSGYYPFATDSISNAWLVPNEEYTRKHLEKCIEMFGPKSTYQLVGEIVLVSITIEPLK